MQKNCCIHGVHDRETDITHFSGEAGFCSSGFTNSQNNTFPMLIHAVPLYYVTAHVLYAASNKDYWDHKFTPICYTYFNTIFCKPV
jgi:hypothetical protein